MYVKCQTRRARVKGGALSPKMEHKSSVPRYGAGGSLGNSLSG